MDRNEQHRDNNRDRRYRDDDSHKLSNYQSRYESRGNYYGMPSEDYEYRNVRSSERADFGNNSSGPVGGYGASSHRGAYNNNDRNSQSQNSNRGGDRNRDNYNYGSGSSQGNQNNHNDDQYRYGDPNPYMNNNRQSGYERTRGTGWGNESGSRHNNYDRQENSYNSEKGKRYEDYGTDERHNYGHDSYNPGGIDMYADRGEHDREREARGHQWDSQRMSNYYDRDNSDREREDYRYSGEIRNVDNSNQSGNYSSSRSSRGSQDSQYDNNSSKIGRRHPSGPDYSKSSSMSDYGRGEFRG